MRRRNLRSIGSGGRIRMVIRFLKQTPWNSLSKMQIQKQWWMGKSSKWSWWHIICKGFDGMFIQDAWYDQGCSLDKILSQGAKMLSFECGNLVFRDSLNFFNMPLEKLPATFNLLELNKGYFPYTWIRPEYYSYRGPYPPADAYNPDRMSERKRKAFLTWHREKVESGAIFDYQK